MARRIHLRPDLIFDDLPAGQIDWSKYLPPPGFRVLPRRWMVERTFAWQGQNRRLSKDYERLGTTSGALIYIAMIRLMLRRLARFRRGFQTVSQTEKLTCLESAC